jgi:hypothetical protein
MIRRIFAGVAIPLLLAFLLFASISAPAQRDAKQAQFLEVRRRQLDVQAARKQYERVAKLADQGLVSQTDLDRDRNTVSTAQLNYQQAVLALMDLEPRISVRSAIKILDNDGRILVKLVIANLTESFDSSQLQLLNSLDGADPIPEQLLSPAVKSVFVSLRSAETALTGENGLVRTANPAISLPYEIHIPRMEYGETKTLNYQLLKDVDAVIVTLSYQSRTQEIPLQLQRAASDREVQLSSSQFSQEADLNGQATFSLTLDRPTVDVRSFQLKVLDLPEQISYSFLDPQSQARLSEINLPAGVTRKSLDLRLYLPERAGEQVTIDKPIEFLALALDAGSARRLENENPTPDRLASGSGKVKLVIIPRGVGKVEVMAESLFSEVEVGQPITTTIRVRNTGSRRLNNVKVSAECPLNWQAFIDPANISDLDIDSEQVVAMRITPPVDGGIGDYEVRVKTESFADNRRVASEDKVYRISVKAESSLAGPLGLIGGILVLVAGIVILGVKMTKR